MKIDKIEYTVYAKMGAAFLVLLAGLMVKYFLL